MAGELLGRVFNNRYRLIERIGVGGMAEVYRAQDNVLGRTVAVKVMLPQYASDPAFTQRFRQEAASAANLQSPFIVNVYDWGQDSGIYYIVMEFVRGSDLKTAILQRGAVNQRKVAEIGSQVCQALSVAHGMDIIHRDIKPQNIMVQPDGNVKVMDFGIARAKNSLNARTSTVLGTAHYISPEQAQGKELTLASDIYSLGITLYEAATGKLPFDGPDAISVAMQQVKDDPVLPSAINPSIDPAFEAIIMKAIAKNPNERFATAKDMRIALGDYLAGRQVCLADGFTGAQTQLIGPAMAAGTLAAAGATAVIPQMSPTHSGQQLLIQDRLAEEEAQKQKKKKAIIIAAVVAALIAAVAAGVFLLGKGGGELQIPDVKGMQEEAAIAAIEEAGFEVGTIDRKADDTVESGVVISQTPKADSKHDKGTKVNLVVSTGKGDIKVPDLAGMTADEARKTLLAEGLKHSEGEAVSSDEVPEGKVVRQDIAAGTKVAKDTTVTYYLSKGKEGGTVPDVMGQTEAAATTALNNAGFYVNVEYSTSDKPSGTVINQSPAAGERLAEGATVLITVSSGAAAKVPSVVGQAEGAAAATLQNAGYLVSSGYQPSEQPAGTVIAQSPEGGTQLDQGGSVYITVSTGLS